MLFVVQGILGHVLQITLQFIVSENYSFLFQNLYNFLLIMLLINLIQFNNFS